MAELHPRFTPYHYCANNPIKYVDPDGMDYTVTYQDDYTKQSWVVKTGDDDKDKKKKNSDDNQTDNDDRNRRSEGRDDNYSRLTNLSLFDERGKELFNRWLNGKGSSMYTYNGRWGQYMKSNASLYQQIKNKLLSDAEKRDKSGSIFLKFHAAIENGYTTGYEMLHGTDRTVGDFQINGSATVENDQVTYDLTLTWNDRIDPNYTYDTDKKLDSVLEKYFNPEDYVVHITWTDKVVIKK